MPELGDIPPRWAQALNTLSDNYFNRRWGR